MERLTLHVGPMLSKVNLAEIISNLHCILHGIHPALENGSGWILGKIYIGGSKNFDFEGRRANFVTGDLGIWLGEGGGG